MAPDVNSLPSFRGCGFATIALATCLLASSTPLAAQPGWTPTSSLGNRRVDHTATLLQNGKVLVAGGGDGRVSQSSAELYDPSTGVWSPTGSLSTARSTHIAVRLLNGKVLVAGGSSSNPFASLTSAELYDPNTGSWSPTGSLSASRQGPLAVLLPNGKVLVAGGVIQPAPTILLTAELYDPATGQWSSAGTLNDRHFISAITLLPDGKALVAAGSASQRAELYDPVTNNWTFTGDLLSQRRFHAAILLANGKVLVSGGGISNATPLIAASELYDPATGQWSATGSLITLRGPLALTRLLNGEVLTGGGSDANGIALRNAELYDPASGSWRAAPDLNVARGHHTATLLGDGKVLVAGGSSGSSVFNTAALFDTGTVAHISAANLQAGPAAAESLVTAKASGGLANTTAFDSSVNKSPGTTLGGTTVRLKDSAGVELLALLDYISPTQVNYIVPTGMANGVATVTITSADGTVSTSNLQIQNVAPSLFTFNDGGLAAAGVVRARNGVQSNDQVFQDTAVGRIALPIDLGPDTDEVVLVLYGTGLRLRSALSNVSVKIDRIDAPVTYAGAQSEYAGLDQINVALPRSLAGRGLVNVQLIVDGIAANIVRVSIR